MISRAFRAVMKWICRSYLLMRGWTLVGGPAHPKFIMLAVPHTSNWDLPTMLGIGFAIDLRLSWMGKSQLFRFPLLGWLLKQIGGIPVRRDKATGAVDQMVEVFRNSDHLELAIAPEGTRSLTPEWRSGFYHIALKAQVPIVMGFIDWGQKRAGTGPAFIPTGDMTKDMDQLRAFYADKKGLYPDLFGPVRLKEEAALAEAPKA